MGTKIVLPERGGNKSIATHRDFLNLLRDQIALSDTHQALST
jgi:hypothetical protein